MCLETPFPTPPTIQALEQELRHTTDPLIREHLQAQLLNHKRDRLIQTAHANKIARLARKPTSAHLRSLA
jgi:hypothetical protein